MRGSNPNASFLTPVARTTRTTDICHKLMQHLVKGDWQEGERLPAERELSSQLGVGRASLREALKALEIMGMIETRLGEGTFVCARSEFLSRPILWTITGTSESLQELLEARKVMEVGLVALAAKRATPKDLEAIAVFILQMEASFDDPASYLEGDLGFHLAVATAAHNSILKNSLQIIRNLMRHDLMSQWIMDVLRRSGIPERALREHRMILDAIANRDPATAKTVMTQHMKALSGLYAEHVSAGADTRTNS